MLGPERTRKPRKKPAPYVRQPRNPTNKDAPKTSAKPVESTHRENLTLHDWKTVFAFIDAHPGMSQGQMICHRSSNISKQRAWGGGIIFGTAEASTTL